MSGSGTFVPARVLQDSQWDDFNFRLAFSPDGRRLAGVNRDRVELRDVEDGREILILRGAPSRSNDGGFNPVVAWSPDGSRLAASTWDGSITVWNGPTETIPAAERWARARRRVFTWHLDEANAAIAAGQPGAAAFHLDELERLEPPDTTSLIRRADVAVRLRRLDAADKDYARWLEGGAADGLDAHLAYARLFLLRGDQQGYGRFLERALESFEKRPESRSVWQLGRIVGLAPCPVADAERVARLIRVPSKDSIFGPRDLLSLAMAQYRAGQWEPARTALEEFLRKPRDESWLAYTLMAMVEQRLGHHREAREQLSKARESLGEHRQHTASAVDFLEPGWFDYERLYHEAETMFDSKGQVR